jgi:hypothetical protein
MRPFTNFGLIDFHCWSIVVNKTGFYVKVIGMHISNIKRRFSEDALFSPIMKMHWI